MTRIMGLDLGDKTIGVALSDPLGWTAQGLETIKRLDIKKDLQRLEEIIKEYGVSKIIIGLPKNMDGSIGQQGNKVLDFEKILFKNFPKLEIIKWDERMTTMAAERTLLEADLSRKKRKKLIDKVAAVYILQGYLDSMG